MQKQQVDTLEKAGGFILDQLVAAGVISAEQQSQVLAQQAQIESETGEKPFVGQLLKQNGIETRGIKQPLLDLQASARALLHAHGETAAAARAEGPFGAVDLPQGVPDNKWTVADMESGDPAREQTALLQTRLVQTKTLAAAASMLESVGAEIPVTTLEALRGEQDAAREGMGASITALKAAGQTAHVLEATHRDLPAPMAYMPQTQIQQGITDAIGALHDNALLTRPQAETLLAQETKRSADINTMQAKRMAMQEVGDSLGKAANASTTDRVAPAQSQQSGRSR